MCGFVAIRMPDGSTVPRKSIENAARSISHRGPDDHGFYFDRNVGFGFRRLSIIDLSNQSHQPFEDIDGRYVMVFNGEIYNYLELRRELKGRGHEFRTSGDTEVLLAAYKEWGEGCVSRLNGMWAFMIYDKHLNVFFGSRDRFGVKPLYHAQVDGACIFASEIKAISASGLLNRELNWKSSASYLLDGQISSAALGNETFFENIREVPAGHNYSIDANGNVRFRKYWELPENGSRIDADPTESLHELLRDAVKLRMRSDVPIGVCLSGGIDSTAIICLMSDVLGTDRNQPLNAFSYVDKRYDETKEIQATIDATGANLHLLSKDADSFLDKLKEVLWIHDEPFHSLNVLISYELYRMAAEAGVKVILNGQGADECWAGYPSYFNSYWHSLMRAGKVCQLRREINDHSRMHQQSQRKAWRITLSNVVRSQLRKSSKYRERSAIRRQQEAVSHPWFTQDLFSSYSAEVPEYEDLGICSHLERSVRQHSLPLYLRVEDRNSMAHSIETRLPFLDYRLVQLAFKSGVNWMLKGGWNKYALRQAMGGVIPEIVRKREDKMGFPVSAQNWFAGPLYEVVQDIVGSRSVRESGVLNVDEVLNDLDRHRDGKVDCSDMLLRVLQFQLLSDSTAG